MSEPFDFLSTFQRMLLEVEYDSLIRLPLTTIAYTQSNPSPFANYALINEKLTDENLKTVEAEFRKLSRQPCLYFANDKSATYPENLQPHKYKKSWEDSWMFFENKEVDTAKFESVREVNSPEMLEIFLSTFDASYQKGDPQNPYGEVKDYLINCRRAWLGLQSSHRLEYFLVYEGIEPVATSILDTFEGMGYISGVGSLQKARGKGYGKLATLFALHRSMQKGNTTHTLATEEGTYPNEFYKRLGFITKFTAVGCVKN